MFVKDAVPSEVTRMSRAHEFFCDDSKNHCGNLLEIIGAKKHAGGMFQGLSGKTEENVSETNWHR